MLSNTVKDQIKTALENAGYRASGSNIELVYQTYMGGGGCGSITAVIVNLKLFLKK